MNLKMLVVAFLGLVSWVWSSFEAEGQEIEFLMKMGHLKQYQAFEPSLFPRLSDRTYLLKTTAVENKVQKDKPPLSGGRIMGEFLVGIGGGVVGGIAGATLVNLFPQPSGDDEAGPIFLGFVVGGVLVQHGGNP